MGKAKPRMHEIPNPEEPAPESKQQQKAREAQERKVRSAMFAHTPEQLVARHNHAPRHHWYDDARAKGDRKQRDDKAIRDDSID
jgi:hypothetical protein